MQTVFIAGSLTIKNLNPMFVERLEKIAAKDDLRIIVGDAKGSDTSIQNSLIDLGARHVTVYCSGEKARNNIGDWPVHAVPTKAEPGSRAFFTAKDKAMACDADYGLMMWDSKSTGTLSNVIELLKQEKYSAVFVNKLREFATIGNVAGLTELVNVMSSAARLKAERKINLSEKIATLETHQFPMAL